MQSRSFQFVGDAALISAADVVNGNGEGFCDFRESYNVRESYVYRHLFGHVNLYIGELPLFPCGEVKIGC